jgi:uncharacterized protein (TIGR02145 family)
LNLGGELGKQGKPAWCYYNNDQSNGEKYGKLYNWHAVNDSRGLAPQGFHIPSKNEADTLMSVSGAQLNEFDEYVLSDAIQSRFLLEGSNEIGLSAVLAGRRDSKGVFRGLDQRTGFWTSNENVYEEDDVDDGLIFSLDTSNDEINELNHSNLDEKMGDSWDIASSWSKGCGYSIRCLRD